MKLILTKKLPIQNSKSTALLYTLTRIIHKFYELFLRLKKCKVFRNFENQHFLNRG
jgi:hypothetical protein